MKNKNKNSQFGTRKEILSNALSILEREIEWSLTEVLPLAEVNKLLAPIRAKINEEIAK
jgi:hypothetical protein